MNKAAERIGHAVIKIMHTEHAASGPARDEGMQNAAWRARVVVADSRGQAAEARTGTKVELGTRR